MSLDYDTIVTLSGDGLTHEILNGFAEHENPRAVFAIPLTPVPTLLSQLDGTKSNSQFLFALLVRSQRERSFFSFRTVSNQLWLC